MPLEVATMPEATDTLYVEVKADLNEASFRQMEQEAESYGNRAGDVSGRGLSGAFSGAMAKLPMLAAGAAVAAGTALAAGAGKAISAFADFESTLSGAQAVLGATAGDMEKLKAQALEMGAKTVFSAKESAEAIEQLGSAGMNTADILGGGLKGALDLAAATGMKDVAQAAEIAAGTMNSFGLAGKDMAQVADTVANAANVSALGVNDFAQAVQAGGSSAKASGLSLNDFTAALSLMADKMIKGSDAGTSMKSFLAALTPNSKQASEAMQEIGFSAFDAQGKMLPFNEIVGRLQTSFKGMTDEQRASTAETIFGSDGIRAFNVLLDAGKDKLDARTTALGKQGAAEEASKTRLNNLKGDMEQLQGSIESGAIAIGETLTKSLNLRGMVQQVNEFVNILGPAFNNGLKTVLPALSSFGGQVMNTLEPSLTQAQSLFKSAFSTLAPIVQSAFAAIRPVLASLGPLASAAFSAVAQLWQSVLRPALTAMQPVFALVFQSAAASVRSAIQIITGVLNAVSQLLRGDVSGAVKTMQAAFQGAASVMGAAMQAAGTAVLNALHGIPGQMAGIARDIVAGLANGIRNGVGAVGEAARGLASGVVNTVKSALRIQSPSKVMQELGEFTAEGFVKGISSKDADLKRAARNSVREFLTSLSDFKHQASVGDVDMSSYTKTLEQAASALRAKLATVKESSPAYHEWYSALTKVEKELSLVKGKTTEAQDAAKKAADELARNRQAIADSRAFDEYVSSLNNLNDAELALEITRQEAAGHQQEYNSVLTEQKKRAQEAAQAISDLVDAEIKAASVRWQDTQAATDSAYRQSYGTGDEGLLTAISALGGLSVEKINADVGAALTDLEKWNKTAADTIRRVYAEALQARTEQAAQETEASKRAIQMADEERGQIVEKYQAEAAAAEDARIIVEYLTGQLKEHLSQGRDPVKNGFLDYLKELAQGSGQAAAAAQHVIDNFNKLEMLGVGPEPEMSGPVEARGEGRKAAAPIIPVPPRVPEDVVKSWDEFQKKLVKEQYLKALSERFKELSVEQLEAARSTATLNKDTTTLGVILTEQESRAKKAAAAGELFAQAYDTVAKASGQTKGPNEDLIKNLEKLRGQAGVSQEALERLIATLQKLDAESAQQKAQDELVAKINKIGDYAQKLVPVITGAMEMLGSATSEEADQWGQDLGSMVSDLTNFGTAVAKGDWAGAAIQALTTIFGWFSRNKKAAEDAAKATKAYNEQFKFAQAQQGTQVGIGGFKLNLTPNDDYYGTRTVEKYSTGILFWQTDHYKEHIDTVKRDLALALEGGFSDGLKSGLENAIAQNDFSAFEKNLKASVGKAVLSGLIESFMQQELLKNTIGPAIKQYLTDHNAATLQTAVAAASAQAETFYNNVLKPVAQQFNLLGTGDGGGTAGGNNGALFGNAPTAQLGVPTISLPPEALKPLTDAFATITPIWESVGKKLDAYFGGSGEAAGSTAALPPLTVTIPDNILKPLSDFGPAVVLLDQASRRMLDAANVILAAHQGSGQAPTFTGNADLAGGS